jgi:hypothetical protein
MLPSAINQTTSNRPFHTPKSASPDNSLSLWEFLSRRFKAEGHYCTEYSTEELAGCLRGSLA